MEIKPGPDVWEPTETEDGSPQGLIDLSQIPEGFRAGFVAVVGRPNVGKSTLINQLVGQKVTIVSDKPQTTRTRLMAIVQRPMSQTVFVDTPGIHLPTHRLGEFMVASARQSLEDADLVLLMVDLSRPPHDEDEIAAKSVFSSVQVPVLLIGNKIDIVRNTGPDSALDRYSTFHRCDARFAISAQRGDGVEPLMDEIERRLPESPPFYALDELTDQPERALCAELIREAVLRHTHQEIPHAVAVVVELFKERQDGLIDLQATLFVERESQKGILIGRGGTMLKSIGADARAEIEALLEHRVYLQLWVKVRDQWRKKDPSLRQLGYSLPGRGRD